MRLPHLFLLFYILILQLGICNVAGTTVSKEEDSKHHRSTKQLPQVEKRSKHLVDATNVSSICGLPLLTKGARKQVIAGNKYKVTAKLINNVNMVFDDIVVRISLPRDTTFRKSTVFPKLEHGNKPALERQGSLIVWRHVHMKPKQSRHFKAMVSIACNTTTPLTFRFYTTVGGLSWITGPEVQVGLGTKTALLLAFGQMYGISPDPFTPSPPPIK
jgi:hypothetical protein